jgi:Ran GTPase-activating protein (RanGAP) involved in mRNA processing and transport
MAGIKKNPLMSSTLLYLNLSQNRLEGEGSSALAQWLAKPNGLRKLRLVNCAPNLDTLVGALIMGSPDLQLLDVSGNRLGKKEAGQLAKLLQSSAKLRELNISATGVPVDAFRELLKSLFGNPYLRQFTLSACENRLGVVGANLIATMVGQAGNLETLLLAENEFGDEGLQLLFEAFADASASLSLRTLDVSGNFSSKACREDRHRALEALIALVNHPVRERFDRPI